MYIDKVRGRSVVFANGFSIGFNYMHSNGSIIKKSAVLMSYHHPQSITWRWCLYWHKAEKRWCWPRLRIDRNSLVTHMRGSMTALKKAREIQLFLPVIGELNLRLQDHMWSNRDRRNPVVL